MSETSSTSTGVGEGEDFSNISESERQSALFAQLVIQQTNMAILLLGKAPHPETGQIHRDLEAAKLFIDQLEVLEARTKGNLTKEEEVLLKQSLMTLRLAYVEAVKSPGPAEKPASPAAENTAENKTAPAEEASASEESKKRFTKKY